MGLLHLFFLIHFLIKCIILSFMNFSQNFWTPQTPQKSTQKFKKFWRENLKLQMTGEWSHFVTSQPIPHVCLFYKYMDFPIRDREENFQKELSDCWRPYSSNFLAIIDSLYSLVDKNIPSNLQIASDDLIISDASKHVTKVRLCLQSYLGYI